MAKPLSRKERRRQEKRARQTAKNPQRVSISEALGVAGQLYEQGELAQAANICKNIAKAAPNHFDAQQFYGILSAELGSVQGAVEGFRAAAEIRPDDPDARFNLGNALDESGEWEAAEEAFLEAHRLAPQNADTLLNLGTVQIKLGRVEDAVESFRGAAERNTGNVMAFSNLGRACMENDNFEEAVAAFEKAIALDPENTTMLVDLGISLRSIGKLPEAISQYERALDIDPEFGRAYYSLGYTLNEYGKIVEAERAYRKATDLLPEDASAHNNLGYSLLKLGREDEAETSFHRAIEIDPAHASSHFNLHAVLYDDQNLDPAIAALEAALEANPEHETAQFFLAMCQEQKGDDAAAIASFDKIPLDENGYNHWLDSWDYAFRQLNASPTTRVFGSSARTRKHAMQATTIDGLTLEFGVRFGTSIRQLAAWTEGTVHGFDGFQGLPEAWHDNPSGDYTTHGEIPEVPDNVSLHIGWFEDTIPPFVAEHDGPIRFMNVDCDIYSSTKTIFDGLHDRIVPGTVIVFDEYLCNPYWRLDEYKAFQEAVKQYGWRYEYLSFCLFSRQAVARIVD